MTNESYTEPYKETYKTTPTKAHWATDLRSRLGIVGELFGFLWKAKLWWVIPMIVLLFVFAIIFIFSANTPLAPFIYSLH